CPGPCPEPASLALLTMACSLFVRVRHRQG
ncbi:MAG: PEP-CTERM sorting domain-containing protein, partial [Phycisphaerales bacterium]|nr:PEP-CTERM sorting domain-containing protein [Phycisphaerales bacterium]